MTTNFIGTIHIIVAVALIILVLVQDSKSNGALGMGGSSGSNSLLGATGAQTLLGKMTVWVAIIFAITCLILAASTSSTTKSVVDGMVPEAVTEQVPAANAAAPVTTETAPTATETAPAAQPAATSEQQK